MVAIPATSCEWLSLHHPPFFWGVWEISLTVEDNATEASLNPSEVQSCSVRQNRIIDHGEGNCDCKVKLGGNQTKLMRRGQIYASHLGKNGHVDYSVEVNGL